MGGSFLPTSFFTVFNRCATLGKSVQLMQLQRRYINSHKTSAAVAKSAASTERSAQQDASVQRQRWQSPVMKPNSNEKLYPLQTCETQQDADERIKNKSYGPQVDPLFSAQAKGWNGILHLASHRTGIRLESIQYMRLFLKMNKKEIEEYYFNEKWDKKVADQTYRVERSKALGPDLAAAHFIVFRDGRVRFHDQEEWVCRNDDDKYNLPDVKVPGFVLKDVDVTNMELFYEGLDNLQNCKSLESINLSGSKLVNSWFIDRICHHHSDSLRSLDISHCPRVSIGGITSLVRLPHLRDLNVDGINIEHLQLACLTLEDEIPGLKVRGLNLDM